MVSFQPDELDVNDPSDLRRAGDLAFLLVKRMRPNSFAMVVVHDDGRGGCVYAHITILNPDCMTGRAPTGFRVHWQVRQASDWLMQEVGMQVIAHERASPQGSYWAENRGDMAAFDQQVGDAITAATLVDSTVDLTTFTAACNARGVEVITAKHEVKRDGGSRQEGRRHGHRDHLQDARRDHTRRGTTDAKAQGLIQHAGCHVTKRPEPSLPGLVPICGQQAPPKPAATPPDHQ